MAAKKKATEKESHKRQVIYRPRAKWDLESIVVYIGQVQGSPEAAKKLFESITNAISNLCEMPELGRRISDERLDRKHYNSWLVNNYRIFYSYDTDSLTVWRIVHTSQDLDDYSLVEF